MIPILTTKAVHRLHTLNTTEVEQEPPTLNTMMGRKHGTLSTMMGRKLVTLIMKVEEEVPSLNIPRNIPTILEMTEIQNFYRGI